MIPTLLSIPPPLSQEHERERLQLPCSSVQQSEKITEPHHPSSSSSSYCGHPPPHHYHYYYDQPSSSLSRVHSLPKEIHKSEPTRKQSRAIQNTIKSSVPLSSSSSSTWSKLHIPSPELLKPLETNTEHVPENSLRTSASPSSTALSTIRERNLYNFDLCEQHKHHYHQSHHPENGTKQEYNREGDTNQIKCVSETTQPLPSNKNNNNNEVNTDNKDSSNNNNKNYCNITDTINVNDHSDSRNNSSSTNNNIKLSSELTSSLEEAAKKTYSETVQSNSPNIKCSQSASPSPHFPEVTRVQEQQEKLQEEEHYEEEEEEQEYQRHHLHQCLTRQAETETSSPRRTTLVETQSVNHVITAQRERIRTLLQEKNKVQCSFAEQQRMLQRLTNNYDKISHTLHLQEQESRSLQNKLHRLENENKTLNDKVKLQQGEIVQFNHTWTQRSQHLKRELQFLIEERNTLQAQRDEVLENHRTLRKQMEKMENEMKELRETTNREKELYKKELEQQVGSRIRDKEELLTVREDEIRREKTQVEKLLRTVTDENDHLREVIRISNDDVNELNKSIQRKELALETHKHKINELRTQLRESKELVEVERRSFTQKLEHVESKYKVELDNAQTLLKSTQNESDTLRIRVRSLEEQHDHELNQIRQEQRLLKESSDLKEQEWQRKVEEWKGKWSYAQEMYLQSHSLVTALQREKDASVTQIHQLELMLRDVRSSLQHKSELNIVTENKIDLLLRKLAEKDKLIETYRVQVERELWEEMLNNNNNNNGSSRIDNIVTTTANRIGWNNINTTTTTTNDNKDNDYRSSTSKTIKENKEVQLEEDVKIDNINSSNKINDYDIYSINNNNNNIKDCSVNDCSSSQRHIKQKKNENHNNNKNNIRNNNNNIRFINTHEVDDKDIRLQDRQSKDIQPTGNGEVISRRESNQQESEQVKQSKQKENNAKHILHKERELAHDKQRYNGTYLATLQNDNDDNNNIISQPINDNVHSPRPSEWYSLRGISPISIVTSTSIPARWSRCHSTANHAYNISPEPREFYCENELITNSEARSQSKLSETYRSVSNVRSVGHREKSNNNDSNKVKNNIDDNGDNQNSNNNNSNNNNNMEGNTAQKYMNFNALKENAEVYFDDSFIIQSPPPLAKPCYEFLHDVRSKLQQLRPPFTTAITTTTAALPPSASPSLSPMEDRTKALLTVGKSHSISPPIQCPDEQIGKEISTNNINNTCSENVASVVSSSSPIHNPPPPPPPSFSPRINEPRINKLISYNEEKPKENNKTSIAEHFSISFIQQIVQKTLLEYNKNQMKQYEEENIEKQQWEEELLSQRSLSSKHNSKTVLCNRNVQSASNKHEPVEVEMHNTSTQSRICEDNREERQQQEERQEEEEQQKEVNYDQEHDVESRKWECNQDNFNTNIKNNLLQTTSHNTIVSPRHLDLHHHNHNNNNHHYRTGHQREAKEMNKYLEESLEPFSQLSQISENNSDTSVKSNCSTSNDNIRDYNNKNNNHNNNSTTRCKQNARAHTTNKLNEIDYVSVLKESDNSLHEADIWAQLGWSEEKSKSELPPHISHTFDKSRTNALSAIQAQFND